MKYEALTGDIFMGYVNLDEIKTNVRQLINIQEKEICSLFLKVKKYEHINASPCKISTLEYVAIFLRWPLFP